MIEMFAGRRWLRVSEAGRYLSLHSKTVYDLISRGLLPCAKVGGSLRVDREKLDLDLERQSQAGQERRGKRP
jgi:excisionase family DNA binding protein